jgi:hypothetical protein
MNVRKGIGGLDFAFLGTKSREMMKDFSDFRSGYRGNHHVLNFGGFSM